MEMNALSLLMDVVNPDVPGPKDAQPGGRGGFTGNGGKIMRINTILRPEWDAGIYHIMRQGRP